MIKYSEFVLDNGLRVIHYHNPNTPLAVLNVLYNVGSRDENPTHTGLAHLFEHLMFSGSVNIEDFDTHLQKAGGNNNAFTNTDITNYYQTLPAENIETAFWLESDRMLSLSFKQEALDVQKGVVVQEFRQRYLNQPYGDLWLKIRPLVYKTHPYNWATIGKSVEDIEKTTLDDIRSFFAKYYNPTNAILCVAGNVSLEKTKDLCHKWFAPIPAGAANPNYYPKELEQTKAVVETVYEEVPQDMVAIVFKSVARMDKRYYASDLLSDVLGRAESSRLFDNLVRKQQLFSTISAYISGESDEGTFVIQGRISQGIRPEQASEAIWEQIEIIKQEGNLSKNELEKVKNKSETVYQFGLTQMLNVATALCVAKNQGEIELINTEPELTRAVSVNDVVEFAKQFLTKERSVTLYYLSKERR
ncbi:MAG: insulinase family protein [Bacteroidia bacterium]|nr:insulinase family protein [Bacteroidia bacterium]MCO5254487.1 insulinase family protein [Bacteroidota bacterium]